MHLKRFHPEANITKDVILRVIVASHNDYDDYATTENYYAARKTASNCLHGAENPYFFILYRFYV